ncbi:RNA-directed DNA polymerase-like protein [Cucumis melo var. makuwa]|uniref:RNA-directed DNA polymerase-like protein n=1 Tax=Cucumis melo var. makuwa TaxID=1194695 RepID=A0A5A7SK59_CUCMM|nr:RNA-directed DNA polymerase-like protein [Cucumis melo var. makuwa]
MAIPVVDEESPKELVPEAVQYVLDEYQDVMAESLPKTLPPLRGIDHEIELLPGARPPAKNAYHTGPPELAELVEFLDAGFIRPAKGPLTELLKKDHKWEWTPESQAAFGDLKKAMMEGPVLGIADVSKASGNRRI